MVCREKYVGYSLEFALLRDGLSGVIIMYSLEFALFRDGLSGEIYTVLSLRNAE